MRYTQDSGVRRAGDSDEYKVVVSVYLTPSERDLWGARKVQLGLMDSDGLTLTERVAALPGGREALLAARERREQSRDQS